MLLTDAQRAWQAQARAFALDEVLPVANELDPQHAEIPHALLERLAQLGYFGLTIPQELGGMGLGVTEYCLVSEELARAWMSVGSVIGYTNGSTTAIAGHPRERELVARMATGEFLAAFALTEPDAGSDAANVVCAAQRDGEEWVITGRKRWCGYARNADAILLYARTSPAPERGRSRGISAFLIEKERGAFPAGLTGSVIPKIGYFGITSYQLDFDGLRLPAGALVGEEGGRVRRRHGRAEQGAGADGGALDRLCPRRTRGRHRLRPRPAPVRQGAGRVPGGAVPAGRDGHPDRGRPAASPTPPPSFWTAVRRRSPRRRWQSSLPPRWPSG